MRFVVAALGAVLGIYVTYVGVRRLQWWLWAGLVCVVGLTVVFLSMQYFESHDVANIVFFGVSCGFAGACTIGVLEYRRWRGHVGQRSAHTDSSLRRDPPQPGADVTTWR